MMEDMKIEAVFSLADSDSVPKEQASKPSADVISDPVDLLPDADDVDEVDIMTGPVLSDNPKSTTSVMPVFASQLADNNLHNEHGYELNNTPQLDESTDSIPSPFLDDLDTPPSLQLEGMTGSTMSPCLSGFDEHLPPILLREFSPMDHENDIISDSPKKIKLNQKIFPSYIVLTKVDRFIRQDNSVSYRDYKRCQTECSNMCKKTLFRRRLNAGMDVFNVKTPTKQKDYLVYLQQYEEEREKIENARKQKRKAKARTLTTFTDMLRIHDRNIKKRAKSMNKKYFSRVRRNISRIPTDFKDVNMPDEIESQAENKIVSTQDNDEKEIKLKMHAEHKRQVESLKRLIMIKRRMNFKLKQLKIQENKSSTPLGLVDGSKSFSGRVRKTNNKYKDDFASSKKEFERIAIIRSTEKMLEQEQKKQKQCVAKKDRKPQVNLPYLSKPEFVIGVENVAGSTQPCHSTKDKSEQQATVKNGQVDVHSKVDKPKTKEKGKSHKNVKRLIARKKKIDATEFVRKTELQIFETRRKLAQRDMGDGVLIQDMPNDTKVLSKFLQTTNVPVFTSDTVTQSGGSKYNAEVISKKFKLTRELLEGGSKPHVPKEELLVKIKQEPIDPSYEPSPAVQMPSQTSATQECLDKYKLLRIPENVQKLFLKSSTSIPSAQEAASIRAAYVTTSRTNVGTPNVKIVTPMTTTISTIYHPPLITMPHGLQQINQQLIKTVHPASASPVPSKMTLSTKSLLKPCASSMQSIDSTQTSGSLVQRKMFGKNIVNVFRTSNPASVSAVSALTSSVGVTNICSNANVNPLITRIPLSTPYVSNLPSSNTSPIVLSANMVKTPVARPGMPIILTNQLPSKVPGQQGIAAAVQPNISLQKNQPPTPVHPVSNIKYLAAVKGNSQPVQQTNLSAGSTVLPVPTESAGSNTNNNLTAQMLTKGKFYLLKVAGKSVLIPTDNLQAQTKAYLVNTSIESSVPQTVLLTQASSSSPTCTSSTLSSPSSVQMEMKPVSKPTAKPTLAVVPNFQCRPLAPTPHSFVTYTSEPLVQSRASGTLVSVSINQASPSPKQLKQPALSNMYRTGEDREKPQKCQNEKAVTEMTASHLLAMKRNELVQNLKRKCAAEMAFLNSQQEAAKKAKQNEVAEESVDDSYEANSPDESNNLIEDKKNISENSESSSIAATEDKTSVEAKDTPKRSAAFSEGVSAREERLRRLKELLKQKQEAVEAIRHANT